MTKITEYYSSSPDKSGTVYCFKRKDNFNLKGDGGILLISS